MKCNPSQVSLFSNRTTKTLANLSKQFEQKNLNKSFFSPTDVQITSSPQTKTEHFLCIIFHSHLLRLLLDDHDHLRRFSIKKLQKLALVRPKISFNHLSSPSVEDSFNIKPQVGKFDSRYFLTLSRLIEHPSFCH